MLFLYFMADQRALDALQRIEQALARIEAAASRPAPVAPTAEPSDEFARLREAHDALRHRVAGAIGQIDRLVESGGHR
jgi:uncharacterized membrane protein YccC